MFNINQQDVANYTRMNIGLVSYICSCSHLLCLKLGFDAQVNEHEFKVFKCLIIFLNSAVKLKINYENYL